MVEGKRLSIRILNEYEFLFISKIILKPVRHLFKYTHAIKITHIITALSHVQIGSGIILP